MRILQSVLNFFKSVIAIFVKIVSVPFLPLSNLTSNSKSPCQASDDDYPEEQTAQGVNRKQEDKMMKILSSPLTKKKINNKIFGVPLEELCRKGRDGEVHIPLIITKVVEFINNHGIGHEGIFRINGNARVVERLKTSFDKSGDADLEDAGDVMAVAGLLKLFLRELPDAVVPESLHLQFVSTQEKYHADSVECLRRLKLLVSQLPVENYSILKYIIKFLVNVCLHEETNKMSAHALSIVFGPNLFRCTQGLEGLREQAITNQIVRTFIEEYDDIFKKDDEMSPYSSKFIQVQEAKVPRVPPAKPIPFEEYERQTAPAKPIPFEEYEKQKLAGKDKLKVGDNYSKDYNSNNYSDKGGDIWTPADSEVDRGHLHTASSLRPRRRVPRDAMVDEDRAISPFVLDSENGSATASPVVPAVTTEIVERTIQEAITQHLFGGLEDTADKPREAPMPSPRYRRRQKMQQQQQQQSPTIADHELYNGQFRSREVIERTDSTESSESTASVKDRIRQFNSGGSSSGTSSPKEQSPNQSPKPKKRQKPTNKAFEVFENQGLVIGVHGNTDNVTKPIPAARERQHLPMVTLQLPDDLHNGISPESSPRAKRRTSPKHSSPKRSPKHKRKVKVKQERHINEDDFDIDESHFIDTHRVSNEDKDFASVKRHAATLSCLTASRAPPPKNRRTPSRKAVREYLHVDPSTQLSPQRTRRRHRRKSPVPAQVPQEEMGGAVGIFSHTLELDDGPTQVNGLSPSPTKKPIVPPLDLASLHEHGDGDEPIPAWSQHKGLDEDNEAVLSPRASKLKKKNSLMVEVPLSPSASFPPNLYQSAPPDTDIPPSPPTAQPYLQGPFRTERRPGEEADPTVKQLSKQIHTLKKKIRQFEQNFEAEFGYKPSHSDKTARPDIKRMMLEMSKAKKQLREVKERSSSNSGRLSDTLPVVSGEARNTAEFNHMDGKPSMEETLNAGLRRLNEKRRDSNRPEDINGMTRDQIMDEKLALQKVLLQFESIHGRPSTKVEKDLMRPLYDRYRNIKRIIAKMPSKTHQDGRSREPRSESPHQSDLQPILEHETMEFPSKDKMSHLMPGGYDYDDSDELVGVSTDFTVTKDYSLLRDTIRPGLSYVGDMEDDEDDFDSPADTRRMGFKTLRSSLQEDATLHEASITELLEKQIQAKNDKKRLRKVLREFEDSFFKRNGRKVQKEDRLPMESEYTEYKQVKARLRLLEALISKHEGSKTI
ncbi:protein FAM13A-like isoform X4 [Ptychodera flava]|uniref:protein FAM13A-like isoform X4 n=1 Tax=Ptychodera flava TaxID=63121 RepID=UPI003969EBF1